MLFLSFSNLNKNRHRTVKVGGIHCYPEKTTEQRQEIEFISFCQTQWHCHLVLSFLTVPEGETESLDSGPGGAVGSCGDIGNCILFVSLASFSGKQFMMSHSF